MNGLTEEDTCRKYVLPKIVTVNANVDVPFWWSFCPMSMADPTPLRALFIGLMSIIHDVKVRIAWFDLDSDGFLAFSPFTIHHSKKWRLMALKSQQRI